MCSRKEIQRRESSAPEVWRLITPQSVCCFVCFVDKALQEEKAEDEKKNPSLTDAPIRGRLKERGVIFGAGIKKIVKWNLE